MGVGALAPTLPASDKWALAPEEIVFLSSVFVKLLDFRFFADFRIALLRLGGCTDAIRSANVSKSALWTWPLSEAKN